MRGERNNGFIEENMSRGDDPLGGKIEVALAFVVGRVSKKYTGNKAQGECVWWWQTC